MQNKLQTQTIKEGIRIKHKKMLIWLKLTTILFKCLTGFLRTYQGQYFRSVINVKILVAPRIILR